MAAAMLRYHRIHPFDLAITLGDNSCLGMESPADPRWETWWHGLYDPLGIRFRARMPATRCTFTAGPVQFFATDTQGMGNSCG